MAVILVNLRPPSPLICGPHAEEDRLEIYSVALPEADGNAVLDARRSARVTKTDTSACSICSDPTMHTMKYQLLQCKSRACKDASNQPSCGWWGKVLTCSLTRTGDHFSKVGSPRKAGLTRRQKLFCQELTAQRMKPVRIRNAIRAKFGLPGDKVPGLRTVQNFVNFFSKAQLRCNDELENIQDIVRGTAYNADADDSISISFTYGKTPDDLLVVGDGSDEEPFVVGITTRKLLRRRIAT
ncbi:hypothetical protein ON010_g438 [Phytophthora cinnamomi]|nr:hypothetical protein ON010_g438 [Phytophthora cinnamomi]